LPQDVLEQGDTPSLLGYSLQQECTWTRLPAE
jgi:hypothetical protein